MSNKIYFLLIYIFVSFFLIIILFEIRETNKILKCFNNYEDLKTIDSKKHLCFRCKWYFLEHGIYCQDDHFYCDDKEE